MPHVEAAPTVVHLADWCARRAHDRAEVDATALCDAAFRLAHELIEALAASDGLARQAERLAFRAHDLAVFEAAFRGQNHPRLKRRPVVRAHVPGKRRSVTFAEHERLAIATRFLEVRAADGRARSAASRGKSDYVSQAWRLVHGGVMRLRRDLQLRCFREHGAADPYLVEVR